MSMKDNYLAWLKLENADNRSLSFVQRVRRCIEYGLLAPSTHNSQPWKIFFENNTCVLTIDPSSRLPVADLTGRNALLSMGCFVENCCIASKSLNLEIHLEENIPENIDLVLIRLTFRDQPIQLNGLDRQLFCAIPKRVNARGLYDPRLSIPEEIKKTAKKLNSEPEVLVKFIENKEQMKFLANMTGKAVAEAQSSKEFRREFGQIMKSNLTRSKVGMPAFSIGLPLIPSLLAPFVFKNVNVSKLLGLINRKAMLASSAIVVMLTRENNMKNWYHCGRSFERINLYFVSQNIKTSIHVAAVEIEKYTKELIDHFQWAYRPQMIFRIGYSGRKFRHTPRKGLEDFIKNGG